jgi:hypothetical protein
MISNCDNRTSAPRTNVCAAKPAPSGNLPKPSLPPLPSSTPSSSTPQASHKPATRDANSGDANITSIHEIERRIPFPQGLPQISNSPTGYMRRINAIIRDRNTREITAHPSLANSFLIRTDTDAQYGTISGLQGCSILVAYNANYIYIAHLWEVPGFSAGAGFSRDQFNTEVLGFLDGSGDGQGPPLVNTGRGGQYMQGASTRLLTVGANNGVTRPNYPTKVRAILDLATRYLGGRVYQPVLYRRPDDRGDPVRVTLEYSARTRHLRVLYADDREQDDQFLGYELIDQAI